MSKKTCGYQPDGNGGQFWLPQCVGGSIAEDQCTCAKPDRADEWKAMAQRLAWHLNTNLIELQCFGVNKREDDETKEAIADYQALLAKES